MGWRSVRNIKMMIGLGIWGKFSLKVVLKVNLGRLRCVFVYILVFKIHSALIRTNYKQNKHKLKQIQ